MEDFKNLQETQLSSQPIFDGDVLHIFKDTIRLPNGKQATREYTVHHGAVCILPLLENGDVLLEHQFRYPMGEVITEIPAGKLDYIGEDPASAALRELREETGAVAGELIPLGRFYPTCAYSTEVIHMYLARQLTFGERELDEDEFLDVFRLPLRELRRVRHDEHGCLAMFGKARVAYFPASQMSVSRLRELEQFLEKAAR